MLKLLKFLKPFTIEIIFIFIFVFCQNMADLKLPDLMSQIVNKGIAVNNTSLIIHVGGIMLLVTLLGGVCSIATSFLSARTGAGLGKLLRGKVFSKAETFSLNEFDKFGTSSLITRTTNDVQQVQMVAIMIFRMVLSAPIMCIGGIIMASRKDAHLTLMLIYIIPVIVLLIFFVSKTAIPLFKVIQKKVDRLNLVQRDSLIGIRIIRAFNKMEYEMKRFDFANKDLTETSLKVNRIMAMVMPIMFLTLNLTTVGILWFGSKRIDMGEMQVGDLMAFIQYAMQILMALIMFSMAFVMIPRASASAERINEVIEAIPSIVDKETVLESKSQKGHIKFENVSFRYEGAEMLAVENVSFEALAGETTAIIGGTGSGKTALVNLIPRFYDLDGGKISIDGIDIKEMSQHYLREKIGYVPQKATLFSGTIAENIQFGKEDATEAEIKEACESAMAMEFISEIKDGINGEVSQGGTNLSGVKKQRLSIARALVRNPEIYIFDDSFSALDFKTDAMVRKNLKATTKNATIIIVAQRISTVMDADRIIVLDKGNIVGIGNHKQLLETNEIYEEIVLSQLSKEELA